ncbi:26S proteasome non-ATPase regulatory subunit 4 [Orbilia oligospora]|uniref:26S proteasome non-ATPase regulatory subunit 4 n=1 Tax=Orbilia oligospora TaxID=2813651 RepID=A0A7C8NIE2_ORBOL|nr:26S proteasome non-ATPase regulatory subunit 4 [Orbilia oligospora]KAF3085613.1 26S proteasome non-ATPase regulatory subunit 4 [Orbilia oligospora]KAF3092535.1 26S proteasome non-ATPase regulatory subunit 4 [Orbilia oligospora]KAF3123311.1 26S proteasome non-ATPase regulatory subunit 4 [Orbilia oligospora]KAF3126919.1 26S proteasome non-ATPase regulatory subunit 4 [Orbilia oligospora]
MVLEATIIIVDNSESSRNGDYTPSRFEAQVDAVSLIFSAKTQANPESSVGLMSMGGKGPEVLATLTADFGKILSGLHSTKISGSCHLATGIQVAGLALKHRQNKSQRQRIIAFVGSPIAEDEKSLIRLAKKMKKNQIAIDFINFGEEAENTSKLEAFIANVNASDNSHLATIPPGPHLLSDQLVTTPILGDDSGMGVGGPGDSGAGGSSGSGGFDFGVDPHLDPELALALRMSLEEENSRQERERKEKEEKEKAAAASASLGTVPEEDGKKDDDESAPLLPKDGESSNKKRDDDDRMDTA